MEGMYVCLASVSVLECLMSTWCWGFTVSVISFCIYFGVSITVYFWKQSPIIESVDRTVPLSRHFATDSFNKLALWEAFWSRHNFVKYYVSLCKRSSEFIFVGDKLHFLFGWSGSLPFRLLFDCLIFGYHEFNIWDGGTILSSFCKEGNDHVLFCIYDSAFMILTKVLQLLRVFVCVHASLWEDPSVRFSKCTPSTSPYTPYSSIQTHRLLNELIYLFVVFTVQKLKS